MLSIFNGGRRGRGGKLGRSGLILRYAPSLLHRLGWYLLGWVHRYLQEKWFCICAQLLLELLQGIRNNQGVQDHGGQRQHSSSCASLVQLPRLSLLGQQ